MHMRWRTTQETLEKIDKNLIDKPGVRMFPSNFQQATELKNIENLRKVVSNKKKVLYGDNPRICSLYKYELSVYNNFSSS